MSFQPIGTASLAAGCARFGLEVRQFDCTFTTFENAISKIAAYEPDIVGISVMATMSRSALKLLETLDMLLPGTLFVAGGPLPTLFPAYFGKLFDVVMRGEAIRSFPRFARDYFESESSRVTFSRGMELDRYPGVYAWNYGNEITVSAETLSGTALAREPSRTGREVSRKSTRRNGSLKPVENRLR